MPKTTSYGTCRICKKRTTKSAMTRHLNGCVKTLTDEPERDALPVYLLKIEAKYAPAYWLYVEMAGDADMADLDGFLRKIWLECCGHMSAFRISKRKPARTGTVATAKGRAAPFGLPSNFDAFMAAMNVLDVGSNEEVDFADLADSVFADLDSVMEYEYDFGSTTHLTIRKVGKRKGKARKLRLIARNDPIERPCSRCQSPAEYLCPFCCYEQNAAYCKAHAKQHKCPDSEGMESMLPIVNSPRMGVCGYFGPAVDVCV